jgi:CheY-like chemotaxis protein
VVDSDILKENWNGVVNRPERPAQEENRQLRLLVIDDEPAVREMFTRLLRLEGYAVRAVASAAEGLEVVTEWRPDAILLDYFMPFMNGTGFLHQLRAHESVSGTPVAIITGAPDANGDVTKDCAALGAALYFKPLGRDRLRNVARSLLSSHGARIH